MSDVGRVGWSPDYKQDELFDPRTTVMPKCPSCGTTAKNACVWEASREADDRRPRGCLVSAQLGPNEALPF